MIRFPGHSDGVHVASSSERPLWIIDSSWTRITALVRLADLSLLHLLLLPVLVLAGPYLLLPAAVLRHAVCCCFTVSHLLPYFAFSCYSASCCFLDPYIPFLASCSPCCCLARSSAFFRSRFLHYLCLSLSLLHYLHVFCVHVCALLCLTLPLPCLCLGIGLTAELKF